MKVIDLLTVLQQADEQSDLFFWNRTDKKELKMVAFMPSDTTNQTTTFNFENKDQP